MAELIPSVSENKRGLLDVNDFFVRNNSSVEANSDFDNFLKPGIYDINGINNTTQNSPFSNNVTHYGTLVVFCTSTESRVTQICYDHPAANIYIRVRKSSDKVWSNWRRL